MARKQAARGVMYEELKMMECSMLSADVVEEETAPIMASRDTHVCMYVHVLLILSAVVKGLCRRLLKVGCVKNHA